MPEPENTVTDQPVQTSPEAEPEKVVTDQPPEINPETPADGELKEEEKKKLAAKLQGLRTGAIQIGGEDIVDFLCNHLNGFLSQVYDKILDYAGHIESGIKVRREKRKAREEELAAKSDDMRAQDAFVEKKGQLRDADKDGRKKGLQDAAEISQQNAANRSWLGRSRVGQFVAGIRGRIQYNQIYREQLSQAAMGNLPEAGISARTTQIYRNNNSRS
ncbi:MAG: hypothetical protein J5716_05320 [Alphaproteobacteria bacterium]|nr:hypothetical protein [Alphaproteobacteria bacterium]